MRRNNPLKRKKVQRYLKAVLQTQTKIQRKLEKIQRKQAQMEARDRPVIIQFVRNQHSNIDYQLKKWIEKVGLSIASAGFNFYLGNKMNKDQVKSYCSQNIIKNLALLRKDIDLQVKQLKIIHKHMKDHVLLNLQSQYPKADSKEINKTLHSVVRQIDDIGAVQNNFCGTSEITFQYRQSENYNDVIMKMINKILRKTNQQVSPSLTFYQQFHHQMSDIFAQKEQNGQKKSQASSAIGRKIGESVPQFSEQQIRYHKLNIKHSSVLRLLVKWKEQLEDKFQDNYFSSSSEAVNFQKGEHIYYLSFQERQIIDKYLKQEKKHIDQFVKQIAQSNMNIQSQLLKSMFQKDKIESEEQSFEAKCGILAHKIAKVYEQQIILYLNKLIHSILKVSKRFYNQKSRAAQYGWTSPPNLLTFKIADLMRCCFSSKQNEVLAVYNRIMSAENKNKWKVVRIKNRLGKITNDILINIKYQDSFLCQIQLAIKENVDEAKKKSSQYAHYFYQIERSPFDPMMQLCSIWMSIDKKSQVYRDLVQKEQKQIKHECLGNRYNENGGMETFRQRFICSLCSRVHFHNNYILNHQQCTKCGKKICAFCLPKTLQFQNLKKALIKDTKLRRLCFQFQPDKYEYGLSIYIESKLLIIQEFKVVKYKEKTIYLVYKNSNKKYQIIYDISKEQNKKEFKSKYIILSLDNPYQMQAFQDQDAYKQYILPQQIQKGTYKKEKAVINLNKDKIKLNTQQCARLLLLGKPWQREKIRTLILNDNILKRMPVTNKDFPNLEVLDISENCFETLTGLQTFDKLKSLTYKNNTFEELPKEIYQLYQLKTLIIQQSLLSISNKFSNLQKLQYLEINFCILRTQSLKAIFMCKELKFLGLQRNQITGIPKQIKSLSKLQTLRIHSNRISCLPEQIFEMDSLRQIKMHYNNDLTIPAIAQTCKIQFLNICQTSVDLSRAFRAKTLQRLIARDLTYKQAIIPDEIKNCTQLQELVIQKVKLKSISNFMVECSKLKILSLKKTKLKDIPYSFASLTALQQLNLANNQLQSKEYEEIFKNLTNLRVLDLSSNKLTVLPILSLCAKMESLIVSHNCLKKIPKFVENFVYLYKLDISNNKDIKKIPKFLKQNERLIDFRFEETDITAQQCVKMFCDRRYAGKWVTFTKQLTFEMESYRVEKNAQKQFYYSQRMFFSTNEPDSKLQYNQIDGEELNNQDWRFWDYQMIEQLKDKFNKTKRYGLIKVRKIISKHQSSLYQKSEIIVYSSEPQIQIIHRYLDIQRERRSFFSIKSQQVEYIKLPQLNPGLVCWNCNKDLDQDVPFYWLKKWPKNKNQGQNNEDSSFGCRYCVQGNISFKTHKNHFQYKSNSVLIVQRYNRQSRLPLKCLGKNHQPQNEITSNNRHRMTCTVCDCKPELGKARYMCLECDYHSDQKNRQQFVDICENCMQKYLNGDRNTVEALKNKTRHKDNHLWLRILYHVKQYKEY